MKKALIGGGSFKRISQIPNLKKSRIRNAILSLPFGFGMSGLFSLNLPLVQKCSGGTELPLAGWG